MLFAPNMLPVCATSFSNMNTAGLCIQLLLLMTTRAVSVLGMLFAFQILMCSWQHPYFISGEREGLPSSVPCCDALAASTMGTLPRQNCGNHKWGCGLCIWWTGAPVRCCNSSTGRCCIWGTLS